MRRNYVLAFILLTACMQFQLPEKDMKVLLNNHKGRLFSDTVSVDNQSIHLVYTANAHEALIVFIHGSPGSWNDFRHFLLQDSLVEKYDMVSVDRPGFGYSDYGAPVPSIGQQSYLIKHALDQFNHRIKIFVGHSLGGPVIAKMAMDYQGLAQALVFLAPSVDPDMEEYEWYRSWIKTWLGDLITPTDFWVSNEEIVPLKEELEEMISDWKKVYVPTVVIHGTNDHFVPVENADFIKETMKDSLVRIKYLQGVDHFIPWSHPAETVRAIDSLLMLF